MSASAAESLSAYLHKLEVERRLSPHTVKAYKRDIGEFLCYCEQEGILLWQGVNHRVAQQFTASLYPRGLSPNTIQRLVSSCRGFFQFLISSGKIESNPFADVRSPKAKQKLPKTLSIEQIIHLVELEANNPISYRDKAVLELFYSTGMRLAELCAIDLVDMGLAEGLVRVTGKGNKSRDLPISRKADRALRDWLKQRNKLPLIDSQAVFVSIHGRRINPRTVQQRVRFWARKRGIDIPVSPHMLRHSFASHMLESSGELRAVQELLGHANLSATQIYTHLDFQHLALVYDKAHPRAKERKK